jgi:predicted house-cleaning noncanonical NTP pyrophosphatase (MazG superfamily)
MKKVTFYSDEDLWKRFSASILEEEGSTRKISEKLQHLMSEYLMDNLIEDLINNFKIIINSFLASDEIKRNRPTVNFSSAEIIREGRDSR